MKSTKKSTPSASGSLKQGTLAFTSVKRTVSTAQAKGKKSPRTGSIPTPFATTRDDSIEDVTTPESSDHIELPSSDESSAGVREKKPLPKKGVSRQPQGVYRARDGGLDISQDEEEEILDLRPNAVRWRKPHDDAKVKMGRMEPVHSEGQNKVHQILRVFDLSYEYGPCIGVTRLERWERASALGLNPPIEIREILLTNQGRKEPQYSQCVFYNEV